jgi:hypothetical protein
MRSILFVLGWLVLLALAQASLNPTIGLLAVVACAVHIGLVLGRRGRHDSTVVSPRAVVWLARDVLSAALRVPARLLSHRRRRSQAEMIGIEVHLFDRRRSTQIERRLRRALRQCARTWGPHPLPVDRVAVHAGAPAAGRAQVYEQWLPVDDAKQRSSLVVISLGLLDTAGRPLDDQQLVGALATKVAALVVERYQRQHPGRTDEGPTSAPASVVRPGRSPAPDAVEPASEKEQMAALMDRVRRQTNLLEPSAPQSTAN